MADDINLIAGIIRDTFQSLKDQNIDSYEAAAIEILNAGYEQTTFIDPPNMLIEIIDKIKNKL